LWSSSYSVCSSLPPLLFFDRSPRFRTTTLKYNRPRPPLFSIVLRILLAMIALRRLTAAASGGSGQRTSSLLFRSFSSTVPPLPPLSNNKKINSKDHDETVMTSTTKRHFHQSPLHRADAASSSMDAPTTAPKSTATAFSSALMARFTITAEVTVSKIFPAGFGWQTGGIVANGLNLEGMNFALMTGLGDAIGVLVGHVLYYTVKKQVLNLDDHAIDLTKETHTGIWLGSAAFCSGTVWQPIVNALQGAGCSYNEVFTGTFITCAIAFYTGLRLGRTFLPFSTIARPSFANSSTDAALSTAIGGASGFFTGTDAVYLPDQNCLRHIVGIPDGTPDIVGAVIAGTSTSLGFVTVQSGLNVAYPKGTCWND
jgi:hypothetical protein